MSILKSETGPLKWLCIYQSGNNYLLNDADIHLNQFKIDLVKVVSLENLQVFTPKEFFEKEAGIVI